MKVVVWETSANVLEISPYIMRNDESIEIPDAIYSKYQVAHAEYFRIMNQIREFQREQERERSYQD